MECAPYKQKFPAYTRNTLDVIVEFPASVNTESLLTVGRAMKDWCIFKELFAESGRVCTSVIKQTLEQFCQS